MQKNNLIYKISLLSLFLALGVIFNYLENLIPVFLPIYGIKLGIANTITLIILYFFSKKEYALIGLLRVLLSGILFIGIFSPGFFLSLSGYFLSTIIVLLLSINKNISIYTLSIASAISHSVGQIICASILYQTITMFSYLPILILTSTISGFLISFISKTIIKNITPLLKRIIL